MNGAFRVWRLFVAAGLAALVALAFYAGVIVSPALARKEPGPDSAYLTEPLATICLGHVDLDNGVLPLLPTASGRVTHVAVRDGELVNKGVVLLRLEDTVPRLQVEEARAALQARINQLAQAKKMIKEQESKLVEQEAAITAARHRLSSAEFARDYKQELFDQKLMNRKDLMTSSEHVEEVRALGRAEEEKLRGLKLHKEVLEVEGVARMQAELNAAEARLGQAREALAQYELRAPDAGRVLRVLVGEGQVLGPEKRQPAVQFQPASAPLVVRAEVDQEFGSRVEEGQTARVEDYFDEDGYKGTGRVRRVSHWLAQPRTILDEPLQFKDGQTLECIINGLRADVSGRARLLRVGQRMRVRISTLVEHDQEGRWNRE
jgi:multidrug resistance efflux pump